MDRHLETEHLALADRHIAAGETAVADQQRLLDRLVEQGHGTETAESLLALYRETLKLWREHRTLIERTLAADSGQSLLWHVTGT